MFFIRISLLVVLVLVSTTWCKGAGGEGKNDRTDEILAILNDMKESVEKVYRMEEETSEHVSKTEDRVAEIVKNEGEMSKKVGNMETRMKTEFGELAKKVEKVDDEVEIGTLILLNSWEYKNWKYLGHGAAASCDELVSKYHTTLQGCLAFCSETRRRSGAEWNGAMWDKDGDQHCTCNKNDRGNQKCSYLHFRVE